MASTTLSDTIAAPMDTPDRKSASKQPIRLSKGAMVLYIVLVGYGIFSLAPFLFAIISSFKTYAEILATPPSLIPNPATLQNYQQIFSGSNLFPRYFLNSLIYAVCSAGLNVVLASMAGYAFGRMQFWGKNVLFALVLGTLMIPGQLIMIPKFLIANSFGLTDNYLALIVPNMVTATNVFLMTQFLKTLPKELEESAMIDGASRFRTLWQVILPLARPAMTAVALFSFQAAWNDFLWPLLVMAHQQNYTLTVGLTFFKGNNVTFYNLLLAGATINILPLVVLFFIFQRYFVRGIATAGLAGR
jgi:multiple sugar transport system permease protein